VNLSRRGIYHAEAFCRDATCEEVLTVHGSFHDKLMRCKERANWLERTGEEGTGDERTGDGENRGRSTEFTCLLFSIHICTLSYGFIMLRFSKLSIPVHRVIATYRNTLQES